MQTFFRHVCIYIYIYLEDNGSSELVLYSDLTKEVLLGPCGISITVFLGDPK